MVLSVSNLISRTQWWNRMSSRSTVVPRFTSLGPAEREGCEIHVGMYICKKCEDCRGVECLEVSHLAAIISIEFRSFKPSFNSGIPDKNDFIFKIPRISDLNI